MNRSYDLSDGPNLAAAIDRLVAGELAATERRALILHLEADPDGWRRCALAFLEDQAWRVALGPAATQSRDARADAIPPTPAARSGRVRSGLGYALAAGLMAVVAATSFEAGGRAARPSIRPQLALNPPLAKSAPRVSDPPPSPSATLAATNDAQPEPGEPIGWVGLVAPDDEAWPRRVPVLAVTAANERWVREQPAAIPAYVRAQWERSGFQVQESHRLVGLGDRDGSPVAVPVDEVAVNYVGRQPL